MAQCAAPFSYEAIGMSATVTIRSFEPSDAEAISRLFGSDGVFEGTLQMPFVPLASRLELFTKTDINTC